MIEFLKEYLAESNTCRPFGSQSLQMRYLILGDDSADGNLERTNLRLEFSLSGGDPGDLGADAAWTKGEALDRIQRLCGQRGSGKEEQCKRDLLRTEPIRRRNHP